MCFKHMNQLKFQIAVDTTVELQRNFEYNFSISDDIGPSVVIRNPTFVYESTNKTKSYAAFKQFVVFMNTFNRTISGMEAKQKDINKTFGLCIDFVKSMKLPNLTLMNEDTNLSAEEA